MATPDHADKSVKHNLAGPYSVTFYFASHPAQPFHPDVGLKSVANEEPALTLFQEVYGRGGKVPVELLQTSLPREPGTSVFSDIIPQKKGFVHTIMEAYNHHRALILRPDDVWLAILTQFNFFVNGNAELLRKHFVNHEGKEKLVVRSTGSRYSVDVAEMSRTMTQLVKTRLVDPELRDWISPTFSTTTLVDTTIYAMIMMASLKEYFSYGFELDCGIPQVTLEGTKEDWESLLSRLEKLKEYGTETRSWYNLLRPIISKFISAYDKPDSAKNLEFWNKVAHVEDEGSGVVYLAGWITAFCFFRPDGSQTSSCGQGLVLDGVAYPQICTDDIPAGYAEVDIELNDNDEKFETTIVAGSIGTQACVGTGSARNAVKPLSAWWYLVTSDPHPSLAQEVTNTSA